MAGSLNKATLIGHCGKDPEIRSTNGGDRVANFSLATSESWTDKRSGDRQERTEWHRVQVWNEHLVKVVENYVRKGSKLYVEGQIQTRKWTDNKGEERYTTEIVLQRFGGAILLLSGKDDGERGQTAGSGGASQSRGFDEGKPAEEFTADFDDEIPF
jgi:single-strand DNA-binding protein